MDTVLTLHIDKNIVENAESYAKYVQKSVSHLVEEYLISFSLKDKKRQLGTLEGKMSVTFAGDFSMTDKELLNS